MSVLLENRDYVPDGAGSVASVRDGAAVLSEALFRLTARKGGFALLPELGSELYLLRNERPSRRAALARQYAAQALDGLEDVAVADASVSEGEGRLRIRVELIWQGRPLTAELEG